MHSRMYGMVLMDTLVVPVWSPPVGCEIPEENPSNVNNGHAGISYDDTPETVHFPVIESYVKDISDDTAFIAVTKEAADVYTPCGIVNVVSTPLYVTTTEVFDAFKLRTEGNSAEIKRADVTFFNSTGRLI
jgi:hypothetical protein